MKVRAVGGGNTMMASRFRPSRSPRRGSDTRRARGRVRDRDRFRFFFCPLSTVLARNAERTRGDRRSFPLRSTSFTTANETRGEVLIRARRRGDAGVPSAADVGEDGRGASGCARRRRRSVRDEREYDLRGTCDSFQFRFVAVAAPFATPHALARVSTLPPAFPRRHVSTCIASSRITASRRWTRQRCSGCRRRGVREPSLTYPLRPSGKSRIVGNELSERFSLAHSFSSPSARNLTTSTFLSANPDAASSNPPTIAWQNGHHGAYSTASVVLACVVAPMSVSIASRSTLVTDPSTKMSSSVASRASCFACSSAVMFPLCRPHSFMALSSHHQRPSRSCCPGARRACTGAHPMETYPISCSLFTGVPMTGGSPTPPATSRSSAG